MNLCLSAIGACVVALAGIAGAPAAGAAANPVTHSAASKAHQVPKPDERKLRHHKPRSISGDITYWCTFHAATPFWLTHESSKLYGTGSITQCSNPKPTGCHMIVDLEELKVVSGIDQWNIIATGDTGWRACTTSRPKNTTTTSYTC